MNFSRAIRSSAYVWEIGIILFTIAIHSPLGENTELIANLTLNIAIIPLAWFGARHYYRKGNDTPGYQLALVMLAMTIFLDATITVPILIMPYGGNYTTFFGSFGFWIIALEYVATVLIYDAYKQRQSLSTIKF
ncbi:MAG: DUF5367 domain-containing protein [Flavobacteriaceae bacterium]|nr:DUF5367 domain-containing protein [Flavobacteriaceae bacterium]